MKKQFDIFLLCMLWLAASALGASFWFNTRFGFDIFSIRHWGYLARLQAENMNIDSAFYLSIVIAVIATVGGLYIIAQPRRRKINMQQPDSQKFTPPPINPEPDVKTETPQTIIPQRPPRLILPNINEYGRQPVQPQPSAAPAPAIDMPNLNTITTPATPAPAPTFSPPATPDYNFEEIEKIFENTGFLVKKPPRIAGLRPALFAIGANETLWIGAVGIEPAKLSAAVSTLNDIFVETLEDIKININAFLLNPAGGMQSDDSNVLKFDTLDDLAKYMNDNANEKIPDSEREDFDAYSEYIDTVSDYFNKP